MIPISVSINDYLRLHVRTAYGTQEEAAKKWGISAAYVSAVLRGHKPPNKTMLDEIGYEKVETVTYRVKESA